MNRQAKAFLLSLTIHLLAVAPLAAVSHSIMRTNNCVVIDLAMLNTENSPDTAIPRKILESGKRNIPLRTKIEQVGQKVTPEIRTETTTPAASASQPPITEVQRPIPGHPDSVEAVPVSSGVNVPPLSDENCPPGAG